MPVAPIAGGRSEVITMDDARKTSVKTIDAKTHAFPHLVGGNGGSAIAFLQQEQFRVATRRDPTQIPGLHGHAGSNLVMDEMSVEALP